MRLKKKVILLEKKITDLEIQVQGQHKDIVKYVEDDKKGIEEFQKAINQIGAEMINNIELIKNSIKTEVLNELRDTGFDKR